MSERLVVVVVCVWGGGGGVRCALRNSTPPCSLPVCPYHHHSSALCAWCVRPSPADAALPAHLPARPPSHRTVVEECEVTKLLAVVDPKTKEKRKAKYAKSGAICIVRVAVEKPICIEAFDSVPQVGGWVGTRSVNGPLLLSGGGPESTSPSGRCRCCNCVCSPPECGSPTRLCPPATSSVVPPPSFPPPLFPPPHPTPPRSPLQLGRFTLRDEGKTIAIGKVLRVPKRGGGGGGASAPAE